MTSSNSKEDDEFYQAIGPLFYYEQGDVSGSPTEELKFGQAAYLYNFESPENKRFSKKCVQFLLNKLNFTDTSAVAYFLARGALLKVSSLKEEPNLTRDFDPEFISLLSEIKRAGKTIVYDDFNSDSYSEQAMDIVRVETHQIIEGALADKENPVNANFIVNCLPMLDRLGKSANMTLNDCIYDMKDALLEAYFKTPDCDPL